MWWIIPSPTCQPHYKCHTSTAKKTRHSKIKQNWGIRKEEKQPRKESKECSSWRQCLLTASPPSPASKACLKAGWPQSLLGWELGNFWFKQQWCTQNNSSTLHFLPTTGPLEKRMSEAGHVFLMSLQMVSWSENWAGSQIQWEQASVVLLTYCLTPLIICPCIFLFILKKNLPCFHCNHSCW